MTRTIKIALTAAALSFSALSAMPALAGDVVVSLRGKSDEQALADIKAGAVTVCRAEMVRQPLGDMTACTNDVVQDTLKQLPKSFAAR